MWAVLITTIVGISKGLLFIINKTTRSTPITFLWHGIVGALQPCLVHAIVACSTERRFTWKKGGMGPYSCLRCFSARRSEVELLKPMLQIVRASFSKPLSIPVPRPVCRLFQPFVMQTSLASLWSILLPPFSPPPLFPWLPHNLIPSMSIIC